MDERGKAIVRQCALKCAARMVCGDKIDGTNMYLIMDEMVRWVETGLSPTMPDPAPTPPKITPVAQVSAIPGGAIAPPVQPVSTPVKKTGTVCNNDGCNNRLSEKEIEYSKDPSSPTCVKCRKAKAQ